MRLVFVTQRVDPEHPALAATVDQIAALAERAEEVSVLAGGADGALPPNARVRLFAAPTRAGRGLRFEAALGRELARRPRPDAVVAHMCPVYAVLASPLARPLGVPVLLWYTHWRAGPMLRAAEFASSAVLTVDRRSFPLESSKVRPIGHGIDVAAFPCCEPREGEGLRALALGRYSPAKGLEAIVRAVGLSGRDVTLDVHGPTLSPLEHEHKRALESLVEELGLGGRVRLGDAVPRAAVSGLFAAHDLLVNNMRPGAPDKVVFEAAASCLPVLASNPVFDTLLDERLRFPTDDDVALAERLGELAAVDRAGRAELGHALRSRVSDGHSVEQWADRILAEARSS